MPTSLCLGSSYNSISMEDITHLILESVYKEKYFHQSGLVKVVCITGLTSPRVTNVFVGFGKSRSLKE